MTQMEAATQQPPHLKALFPFDLTDELWDAAMRNGLFSSAFITPWQSVLGIFSAHTDHLYRLASLSRDHTVRPATCNTVMNKLRDASAG